LLTYCGVLRASLSLFLRHTPPAPNNIFAVAHTPFITHTNTPPVTHHAQDRSHVPLEPRRRSPHPCKPTARFNTASARPQRSTKPQNTQHQTKAREHVNSSATKHHVKCELHLPEALSYKAEPLPERRRTNSSANRPAAAARPPHKHRSPHSTAATPSQTARCLALRALRSASIPMAP